MEQNPNKNFYSIALVLIKVAPMLLAITFLCNTILSMFGIDDIALVYIKETIVLTFLYVCSYLFRLCYRYRLFLHYLVFCDVVNIIDYYFTIPVDTITFCAVLSIISVLYFFFVLYKFMYHG